MPKLPLYFLSSAAACLVIGVTLGIAMGISHDFRLGPVHAHLNLLGWTSLALMGLTYRAYPVLADNTAAAVTQFALSGLSALVFPIGVAISIIHGDPLLAIGASLVWLAGAVLFLVRLLLLAFREPRPARARTGITVPAE